MIYLLVATNAVLFVAIAALHVRWAFQHQTGSSPVVPTLGDGTTPLFRPRTPETLVVAIGLLGFAFVTVSVLTGWLPTRWPFYGNLAIGGIFLLRAVGEFRYVGFFKKVRNTAFARYDTFYYSPLCLLMSAVALGIGGNCLNRSADRLDSSDSGNLSKGCIVHSSTSSA
ncbi:MAG: DUF3995 domain-containing protein [Cytophagaceae bacterium]|nr:DUF3995 domain-containing protein [Cytophagaceae bacterium]